MNIWANWAVLNSNSNLNFPPLIGGFWSRFVYQPCRNQFAWFVQFLCHNSVRISKPIHINEKRGIARECGEYRHGCQHGQVGLFTRKTGQTSFYTVPMRLFRSGKCKPLFRMVNIVKSPKKKYIISAECFWRWQARFTSPSSHKQTQLALWGPRCFGFTCHKFMTGPPPLVSN